MGSIRYILAVAVLLSHVDIRVAGLNPGVMAVIGFYMISGYVMTGLIQRHYNSVRSIHRFYLDRLLRLYPQYLLICALVLLWLWSSDRTTQFLSRAPIVEDFLNNILIIPMNFFMWNGADQFALVPPSWSLGTEMQFYLLAPLVVISPVLAWMLGVGSVFVQVLAWLGLIHPEWFGYRLLPGVLCFFLYGVLVYRLLHAPATARFWRGRGAIIFLLGFPPVIAALVLLWLRSEGLHSVPYHQEVLIGFGVGGVLLVFGALAKPSQWDSLLGDLAYGVFVNHFLLIWLFGEAAPKGVALAGLVALSTLLAYLTFRAVEQPALRLRHRIRRASSGG